MGERRTLERLCSPVDSGRASHHRLGEALSRPSRGHRTRDARVHAISDDRKARRGAREWRRAVHLSRAFPTRTAFELRAPLSSAFTIQSRTSGSQATLRLSDDAVRRHAAVTTDRRASRAAFQRLWATGLFAKMSASIARRTASSSSTWSEKPLLAAYRHRRRETVEEEELARGPATEPGSSLHANRAFGDDDVRTVERDSTQQFLGAKR